MPIVAILVGVILIDLSFRGTEHQFAKQFSTDFGQGSQFFTWFAAIVIIGSLGYVQAIGKLANLLLALVLTALVVRHGGLFERLAVLIENPPPASAAVPISGYGAPASSGGGAAGSAGGSNILGAAAGAAASAGAGAIISSVAPALLALL